MSETPWSGRAVAVTGATGFIGTHVVAALRARQVRVVSISREANSDRMSGVEHHCIDIESEKAAELLARSFDGVSSVVHLAGRAHFLRVRSGTDRDAQSASHVQGTRACLEAAQLAGIERFIFLSSVGAVAQQSRDVLTDATSPTPSTAYGRAKLEAERLVTAAGLASGFHTAILRAPTVYGAGMRGNPLRLFRLVDSGLPLPLGGIENLRSVLYVENLVDAIMAELEAPPRVAPSFVSDGPPLSTTAFVRHIADALGRPSRLVRVPPAFWRIARTVSGHVPSFIPNPLSANAIVGLTGTLMVDERPFWNSVGMSPQWTTLSGIEKTGQWYLKRAT